MAKKKRRLSMHKLKEIIRLRLDMGLSHNQIAKSVKVSSSTVSEVMIRVKNTNYEWAKLKEMDEDQLQELLYPPVRRKQAEQAPEPNYTYIYKELRKKNVTLMILWEEYIKQYPGGYRYSYFCELYQKWCRSLEVTLRQIYRAGEKTFIDYAGQTVPVFDPEQGKERMAQIFVSVLGASSYTYAEATWRQDLPSWIRSHTHAMGYYQGSTQIWVPDNLKSGVIFSCRYEPGINLAYQHLADYYGAVVIPARVKKPRDKAKVESGVLQVERWILARLRNKTFTGLPELNQEIFRLLEELNNRPMQKLGVSRRHLYETLDKPALKPLPEQPYELALFSKIRVGNDYHVFLEKNYYSVPYRLVNEEVYVRYTLSTVEILHKGKRVASHLRSYETGKIITCPQHRPKAHREYLDWTPSRVLEWAQNVGPMTFCMVKEIFQHSTHESQGLRSCMGLVSLERHYSSKRLEKACARAVHYGSFYYKSVKAILKKGLDELPAVQPLPEEPLIHPNIRGASYYQRGDGYAN